MPVAVEAAGDTWRAGTPAKLVDAKGYAILVGTFNRNYDVSPDGQRFLLLKAGTGSEPPAAPPSIIVVQHWDEELKRLVPAQ